MSYLSEDQIAQQRVIKQQYLKSEIIEKGYDGAAFGEFLEGVRPDGKRNHPLILFFNISQGGSDVDIWSIDELKDVGFFSLKVFSLVFSSLSPDLKLG